MPVTLETADTNRLRVKTQTGTVSTPASGYGYFYDKSKSPAFIDSDGNETILAAGTGDVVGPGSATDGNLVVFDGTTGKLVKDGGGAIGYNKTATMFADEFVVTAGNALVLTQNSSFRYGFYISRGTAANGDELMSGFAVPAGTYSISFLTLRRTDEGIMDVYVDSTEVGSIDLYGSSADNVTHTITGVVITAGYHSIKMKVDGKNGSSSDYQTYLIKAWLTPAAF